MPKPPKPPKLPATTGLRIKAGNPRIKLGVTTKDISAKTTGAQKSNGVLKPAFKTPKPIHYLVAKELVIQYFEDNPEIIHKSYDEKINAVLPIYQKILNLPQIKRLFNQIEEFELLAAHIRNTIENALGVNRWVKDT